jgi:hypothetical protein
MRPIKLKKRTDEDNLLGFDEIEIIDTRLISTYKVTEGLRNPSEFYVYIYTAIADGQLIQIHEDDWESFDAYDVVG